MKALLSICVVIACCVTAAASEPQTAALKDAMNRLDQAAKTFRCSSAQISWTKHTAVLPNDDSTETGTAYRGKTPKGLLGRIEIATPDIKAYAFEGRTIQIYYPNLKEVDIYDAGEYGQQVEQFLMLGFGTTGVELEKAYEATMSGTETVNGEKTVHLTLIPKSAKARELVKQVDLWISARSYSYPVQEKILEKSGNYSLLVFSDVKINPTLKDADLKLKLPQGVTKRYPQREK